MSEQIRILVGIVLGALTLAGFYYWVFVWVPPEYQAYLDKIKSGDADE